MSRLSLVFGFLLLSAAAAFGTTVTFTEIPLANGTAFTTQYAAFDLNGVNDYIYFDSRDTFDGVGVSDLVSPGIIQFLTPVSALSIDYVLINGVSATFQIFDSLHNSLAIFTDNALAGDKNASHTFGGTGIAELDFSGSTGVIGVSTLRFNSTSVPEPSSLLLVAGALAGLAWKRRG